MKYIIEPKNITQFRKLLKKDKVTDIMVGVEELSNGFIFKMSLETLNQYLEKMDALMISLKITRIFHEEELQNLKEKLLKLKWEKIKFIFYSDLGVYEMIKAWGYQNKLVYDANTYMTNADDVNAFLSFNKYVVVSNQIAFSEIEKLLSKVKRPTIIYGFGKSIIFYSKRPLLKNYFLYRNLKYKYDEKDYYLKEEYRDDFYHIYEDQYGSYLYEPKFYYLYDELKKLQKIDYVIISCVDMKTSLFEEVVNGYLNNDSSFISLCEGILYKGIMKEKSVLLKDEVIHNE